MKNVTKLVGLLIAIMMFVSVSAACRSVIAAQIPEASKPAAGPAPDADAPADQNDSNVQVEKGYSIQDVLSDNERPFDIYIFRDEYCYSLAEASLSFGAYSYFELKDRAFAYEDDLTVEKLSRLNGDKIIAFSDNDSYTLYPINKKEYCVPAEFMRNEMFDPTRLTLNYLYLPITDFVPTDIVVRPNFEFIDDELAIEASCLMWFDKYGKDAYVVGNKGESHTLGRFVETEYFEYRLICDATLYWFDTPINTPVERTKHGYFIVSTDSLSTGSYAISCNGGKCLFEVVD